MSSTALPRRVLSFVGILIAASAYLPEARMAFAIDIGTSAAYHEQRFEAWGTSLAWMGHELGGSSNTLRRNQIMDLLFDQTNGLGLNYVRYNIGAGQNPAGPNITRPGADMDGWVPSAPTDVSNPSTWNWDWNADATQRWVLNAAIDRGVTQVEAFANSAPWWMTIAQSSSGNPAGGANLDTANYDEFAHYLLEVSNHFKTNLGIQFHSLAPMNEPGAGWWSGGSKQEGMNVPLGSRQSSLIREFGMEIQNRGLDLDLVGPEETSTDQTLDSWRLYGTITKSYISQINTHSYPFNGGSGAADSAALQTAAAADGKKIYASEYGTGSNSTPVNGGIKLANQITSDLENLKAAGWTYWQAVEDNNGSNWGLIIAPFDGNNNWFNMRRQYYSMQQFTSYIRPGAQILNQPNDETIAAYDPRTGTTTLVVTNDETTTDVNQFTLLDKSAAYTRMIRTSDTESFKSLGAANVNGSVVTQVARGNTVTTIVVHHRPNLIENASFERGAQPNGSTAITGWNVQGGGFYDTQNNSIDTSESGALFTNGTANSGEASQSGIGDADTDLTGVAFEFSLDVMFQNAGTDFYDADTHLAIEFYGADDQTLVHSSNNDFQTLIIPALGIDETKGTDSDFRTYRTERFVAPAGTRYVRPVIRYGNVDSGSNDWVFFDNAYLQMTHPVADAREWTLEGSGDWATFSNWMSHAKVENNSHMYFGNAIDQASTVTLESTEVAAGLTFFSEHAYHLQGPGQLNIGSSGETGFIDTRWGSHRISVDTELLGDANLQVLPGSTLKFDSGFDLKGHDLTKLGAGDADFASGFVMDGGSLRSYASIDATIALGADSVLDGTFELLVAPGQMLEGGDLFELASYTSLNDTFDDLILPQLSSEFEWDVQYGQSALTAEVVFLGPTLDGDFNDDGIVNAADFTMWRDNIGKPDGTLPNDGSLATVIGRGHYALWRDHFGESSPTNALAVVPEPACGVLLMPALVLAAISFRKRRPRRTRLCQSS